MKKRMSRLLSALLVLAMLCAMVPAVLAADSVPSEMWVGDTFTVAMPSGCTGTAKIVTFTNKGVTNANSSTIRVNTDGTYTATSAMTNKAGITITVKGNESKCSHSATYDTRVYNNATRITAKVNDVTVGTSGITIVSGDSATIAYTLYSSTSSSSTDTVKQAVVLRDNGADFTGVGTVSLGTNKDSVTVTANSSLKGTNYGYVIVDADDHLALGDSKKASSSILVEVIEKPILELKAGNTTVASSETEDKDLETHLLGTTKVMLTTNLKTTTGNTNKVTWSSDNPQIVTVLPNAAGTSATIEGRSTGKGTATITATYTLKNDVKVEAKYKVIVGKAESLVVDKNASASDNTDSISTESLAKDEKLTLYAHVDPETFQNNVTWTIDDTSVLQFDGGSKSMTSTTGANATFKGIKAGTATVTAKVGDISKKVTVTVTENAQVAYVTDINPENAKYTVRYSANDDAIIDAINKACTTVPGYAKIGSNEEKTEKSWVDIPVTWVSVDSKTTTSAKVTGRLKSTDSSNNLSFNYTANSKSQVVELSIKLTDEAAVTSNVITASKTSAVAGDKVTFSAKAAAEPSDAKLAYQWYKNGTRITGATSASYTFTVPEASEDSTTAYRFTCGVTATRNGTTSAALESNTVTLNVARDYSIELTVDDSKAAYTVGETPKVTATVYKWNGSSKTTVSNVSGMSWDLLDASTEKSLSSNIATVSGSGTNATVTTKATGNASGQKITVQATVSINGYTYTGKKDITLSAATASFTMSGGTGSNIKATTIQSKAKAAVGSSSNVSLSYVKFDTPRNCTLTKSSSSSTAIGSTACYFSTTTGQKLSDVYVKLSGSATSGSVVYTVYDTNDNAVVTGTITFDSTVGEGGITCVGVQLDDVDVVEMIEEEFADASGSVEYVIFDTLASKYGRLLTGYKGIVEIDKAKDVTSSDKFYLKGSSSVSSVEDVYLLPRTDYYGTIELSYTAYSSSSKSLGEGKLTFTVVRKTASSKFTDVTAANVGSWAADAIDFMAENGLVGGTGNNKFTPTGTMTRGDLVLIMYRMAGQPSVTGVTNPFTDVAASDYYYKAVLWAYENGVVNGTGNGTTFSPKSNITREQIATILYRYSGTTTATGSITSFTDASSVSDYALAAMRWAVGAGVIGGSNNKLNPQGNATRAEVTVMLHRFLNK